MKKRTALITLFTALTATAVFAGTGEIKLPPEIPSLLDWLLANKAVSVVKYASVITMVVQIVKAVSLAFGAKMNEKWSTVMVALIGFATLIEQVTADGVISGGDWSAIIVSFVSTIAAFFGYKILFSPKAPLHQED